MWYDNNNLQYRPNLLTFHYFHLGMVRDSFLRYLQVCSFILNKEGRGRLFKICGAPDVYSAAFMFNCRCAIACAQSYIARPLGELRVSSCAQRMNAFRVSEL